MASFPRAALFFLVLFVAPLFLCSSATTLDEEERQKEEQALEREGYEAEDESRADGVPDPPQNLIVDPQSDTVVMLFWQDPADDTDLEHYYVYVEEEDMEQTTRDNYCIFPNLEACTNYTFGVMSVSAEGNMSDPILGEGQTLVGGPPAPEHLQVDDYSSTTVTLSWDKPDTLCVVEGYKVKWSTDGANIQSKRTNETSFTVTELSINTSYIFDVIAFTSYGKGLEAATVEQTTALFDGGPPENLVAVGISMSEINVSWTPPSYAPLYYVVTAPPCVFLNDIVFGLSYPIEGRAPCDSCNVFVTSYYNDTFQYTAQTIGTSQGGDPPPPKDCSVVAENGVVQATWSKPDTNCQVGLYSVDWKGTKLWGDRTEESGNLTTAETKYTEDTPVPYSKYTFEISASIDNVFGSPASCSGTSQQTQPGASEIVAVDSVQGEADMEFFFNLPFRMCISNLY